jgi:outer membrane receptor protein involved in Fe transport
VELAAYYTYEKDATTNQWSTTTGVNLNNKLKYAGTDKTDTFGLDATIQLKPDVWKLWVNAMRQKVDGLMDITARESGSFYTPGRTTLVPAGAGGAQDIGDWDDTTRTTVAAQLDYAVAKAWTLTAGYVYEKYEFKDAYTAGDLLMPQSVLLFLKSNSGGYDANVLYGRLSYQF